jgi:hypothetical protein
MSNKRITISNDLGLYADTAYRIICDCGYMDKTFSHDSGRVAKRHNDIKHSGKYLIMRSTK